MRTSYKISRENSMPIFGDVFLEKLSLKHFFKQKKSASEIFTSFLRHLKKLLNTSGTGER
jgi:predicted component of type VI protein secretion system